MGNFRQVWMVKHSFNGLVQFFYAGVDSETEALEMAKKNDLFGELDAKLVTPAENIGVGQWKQYDVG